MAQKYTLSIEPEAIEDIQQAIDYYNSVKSGLGKKFFLQVDNQFNSLRKNPKAFAVRYNSIRCLPIRKFPYMIHYMVFDDKLQVSIKAVFCTYLDPSKWEDRT